MNVGEVKEQAALGRFLQEATNITTCVTLLAGGFSDVFLVCTGFWGKMSNFTTIWVNFDVNSSIFVGDYFNRTAGHFT